MVWQSMWDAEKPKPKKSKTYSPNEQVWVKCYFSYIEDWITEGGGFCSREHKYRPAIVVRPATKRWFDLDLYLVRYGSGHRAWVRRKRLRKKQDVQPLGYHNR